MFHCFIFSSCHFFWGQSPSQSAPKPTINTQENSQQISHFLSAAITIYGAPNPKKSPQITVFLSFFLISRDIQWQQRKDRKGNVDTKRYRHPGRDLAHQGFEHLAPLLAIGHRLEEGQHRPS